MGDAVPIRIFLISNHRLLLRALADMVSSRAPDFLLAGSSDCLAQSLEPASTSGADVVLLDLDSGHDDVLAFITALHAACDVKTLLLTRLEDQALQDKGVLLGARGVIERDASPEMLFNALQKVSAGQYWLNHEATGRVFVQLSLIGKKKPVDPVTDRLSRLTEREQQIVAFIAASKGESSKTIADHLHISQSTLRNHLTSIYEKLGVTNRHGLLAYAFQNDLKTRLEQ
jgi:DNA-binding NarL/FixJ family response regulator